MSKDTYQYGLWVYEGLSVEQLIEQLSSLPQEVLSSQIKSMACTFKPATYDPQNPLTLTDITSWKITVFTGKDSE